MRLKPLKYIISLFFLAIFLVKGTVCVMTTLACPFKFITAELTTDCGQETNEAAKSETAMDEELFGKALLPEDYFLPGMTQSKRTNDITEPLRNVYLDTSTPPPIAC